MNENQIWFINSEYNTEQLNSYTIFDESTIYFNYINYI